MKNVISELQNLKFKKIGSYSMVNEEPKCEYTVKKTTRKSIVYAFVCNNEMKYFGKSIQGYGRPLSYLKFNAMKTVRDGIIECCKAGDVVDVYIREDNLTINYDGLDLNIIEALEQALITHYQPNWNNFKQKALN